MNPTTVISGAFWMMLATGLSRVVSLLAQVVLGWFLAKEDFGLFAIILAISSSVAALRNGGAEQILIQRGREFKELSSSVFIFSLIFNLIAFTALMFIGLRAEQYYSSSTIMVGLVLVGGSIILATPAPVLIARLSIGQYFHQLSFVTFISSLLRYSLAIILALIGFSVYSFIIPLALEPIIALIMLFYIAKAGFKFSGVTIAKLKDIFSATKWIMLSNFAVALMLNGQYFFVSLFKDKAELGVYFFAMQLIVSFSVILSQAVNQVLFPGLSNKVNNIEQHFSASIQALRGMLSICSLSAILILVFIEPVIHLVWSGKWDESIACVEWLAFSIPASLLITVCVSIVASKGSWRLRFLLLLGAACVDVLSVTLASAYGDVEIIALSLTLGRLLYSIFAVSIVYKLLIGKFSIGLLSVNKLYAPLLLLMGLVLVFKLNLIDINVMLIYVASTVAVLFYTVKLIKEVPENYFSGLRKIFSNLLRLG
jgi:O-antigen/teichoic acid export membrane protein